MLALAATAVAAVAPHARPASRVRITARGAGSVKLGARYKVLHAKGVLGRLNKGCQLAGPKARGARLKAPLRGSVTLSTTTPRTVTDIFVTGGGAARGIGVGASLPAIKSAFPKAKVDHSTEGTFGITLVKVPRGGGGKLQFAVDVRTHKVSAIGVPVVPFCE